MSVKSQVPSHRGELFKDTLNTLRAGKCNSPSPCPLSSPSIGVISENDHRVRQCLCPICTCGKHICPYRPIQDPYPTSTFNSQYMSNFQSRSPQRTQIPSNRGNFLPAASFDFETSNEEAYRPHNVSAVANITKLQRNVPSTPPRTAFNAKSSYANNFVDWGTAGSGIVKTDYTRHTTEELKMAVKTSYRENYCPIRRDDAISARPDSVKIGKNTHIDPKALFLKDTTNRREFLDFSRVYDKEKGYKQVNLIPRMRSVDSHYVSTTKNDYKDMTTVLDHRMLRRVIDKEGLLS